LKKKILIVGGTGFIGFNLIKKLKKKNFEIYSLSRKKPENHKKINRVKYILCNLSDTNKLNYVLKKKNFSYVVNLGGDIDHNNKLKVRLSHYEGVKNLANIFLKKKIKKFIQIGSSIENGKVKSPQKENLIKNSFEIKSHYGRSKHLATKFLLSLHKNFFFPVTVFRLFQVYGPYQDTGRLIPFVITNCLKNFNFPCSSGNQYRDFIYVDDLTNLIVKSLYNINSNGKIFNVGSGKAMKVKNVILIIKKLINKGNPEFGKIKLRKDEIKLIFANIYLTKKIFKWEPKIIFKNGIKKTINYLKKYEKTNQ